MADRYRVTPDLVSKLATSEAYQTRLKRDTKLLAEKEAGVKLMEEQQKKRISELIQRTEGYEAEYEKSERDLLQKREEAAKSGGFYKPADPKVLLLIRIKGIHKVAPKPRKVLQLFRLLQVHNAVFVKVNKATLNMLKYIEPFVAYGYPSLETVRALLYKRGSLRVGAMGSYQRIRIQDNELISKTLGEYGVHGVEDIVHEIVTCGPNFKLVNKRLWAFKLRPPTGGFICKRHGFTEFRKGDWGNREHLINELVGKMM